VIKSIIVAVSENNVIGKDNALIWHFPEDMKYFKEKTTGHVIITGRKNYESIPEKFRPLPNRTNIVITRQSNYNAQGAIVVGSVEKALAKSKELGESEVFIIGGAEIYKQCIDLADRLYITRIHKSFEGDAFFPEINLDMWQETNRITHYSEKNNCDFSFIQYEKKLYSHKN
jgi:dihydrofolate reductase